MSQPVRPGNRERGWNDPPEFLHSEGSTTLTPQKRTILNQRVAHSFDGKVDETKPETLSEPPKLTAPPVSQVSASTESHTVTQTDEPSLNEISVESIEKILNDNVQLLKDNGLAVNFLFL